jgi:hypothetical protein
MVDTSITPPARLDPPYREPMLDAAGLVTQLWRDWFTGISLALFGFAPGGGGGVIMQTGTSTSDPSGLISVTLPTPYSARTLDFQCDGSPDEANAYFNQGTVVALPLDVITGTLSVLDTGTGTIVPVANTDFTWFATGV